MIDGTKAVCITCIRSITNERVYYIPRFVYYREDNDSFEMRPPIGIKSICVDLMADSDLDMRHEFYYWLSRHGEAFLIEDDATEDEEEWLEPELTNETFEYACMLGNKQEE